MLRENLSILNRFNQSQSRHLQRYAKCQIAGLVLILEVRLGESAVGNGGIIRAAAYRPQLMDAAIGRPIWFLLESYFPNRPELFLKTRDGILPAVTVRNQSKLRVLRLTGRLIRRIRNEEAPRSSQRW